VEWHVALGGESRTVRDLLDVVERHRADLLCAHRNLHTEGWRWPFTLGDHVEVLTQATTTPVLVLPHPHARRDSRHELNPARRVMAMTDHLTGDESLINHAASFTPPDGRLLLTHIEDDLVFDRYLDIFSKIPTIDTDHARETVSQQLLKEPAEYIDRCARALADAGRTFEVTSIVTFGHLVSTPRELIREHEVDLLVMNTKDEDQLAMHGLAHPLAVELRDLPLLML
jgi:nucleotide-binding universal stress UspA family protein